MGDQTTAFAKKYSQNIELLATTVVGEFDGKVAEDTFTDAEECYWEQLGGAAENEITEANGQQVYRQLDHLRRMVYTSDFELPLMLDKRHQMRSAVKFESTYTERTVEAYKRSKAIAIFKGVFSVAFTGKNGTDQVAFDYAAQAVDIGLGADSGDAGLTKEKLIKARTMLKKAGYNLKDRRYQPMLACTAQQISDLLNTLEATSSDFSAVQALESGERTGWLGFEFVVGETVPFMNGSAVELTWVENAKGYREPVDTADTSIRACFAYVKDCVGLHTSEHFTTEAGKIERFRYNWGLYAAWSHGAVRRQEDGIVLLPCTEVE